MLSIEADCFVRQIEHELAIEEALRQARRPQLLPEEQPTLTGAFRALFSSLTAPLRRRAARHTPPVPFEAGAPATQRRRVAWRYCRTAPRLRRGTLTRDRIA
jgi:hypothetical protein